MSDKRKPRAKTKDKCNVCGWVGLSDDVIQNPYTKTWHCPICNSEDVDPWDFDAYNDDNDGEDDPDDGSGSRLLPVGGGPMIGGSYN